MIGIDRSLETLARAQVREGPKHDVTVSLRVNKALLVGLNLRNSMFLAGCRQPPWRSPLSHGNHVAFPSLNVYLIVCTSRAQEGKVDGIAVSGFRVLPLH